MPERASSMPGSVRRKAGKPAGPEPLLLRLQHAAGNAAVESLLVQRQPAAGAKKEAPKSHRALHEGDKGPEVEALQRGLMFWLQARMEDVDAAGAGFPETGKFDLNTRLMVMYFQQQVHREPTGAMDVETWAVLEQADVNQEVSIFGTASMEFEQGHFEEALIYLELNHPLNPRAAALVAFRMAACYQHLKQFDKAVAKYGEVIKHPGADDKVQGAAAENQELARQGQEFHEYLAVDREIWEEIGTEQKLAKPLYPH